MFVLQTNDYYKHKHSDINFAQVKINWILKFIDYLKVERNYSDHTLLAYQKDILQFQVFLNTNAEEDLLAVSYREIRMWIVELVDAGISHKTVNRKITSLKSFYNYLLKIEEISFNPLTAHKALKAKNNIQVPFSTSEVKKVLEMLEHQNGFTDSRNRLIIELFYTTGIRRAELMNIKLTDFDSGFSQLKILGKQNKERIVPLLNNLKSSIEKYLQTRLQLREIMDAEYLFLTEKGKKMYDTLVYRIIKLYFSTVSNKLKCSPHMLRHTFATHMLNNGADLKNLKELLGHSSLASTQVYTHSSLAKLKEVYAKSHPRNNLK